MKIKKEYYVNKDNLKYLKLIGRLIEMDIYNGSLI
jgi:hypothetical protein